ncbi:MAG: electron transfer flavoprotein subunit alpha/FixB family protein [Flavobacteriales bacterium TMED191]|nr:MAG: electron transfer flavoprotein subunit alpha/FixB family protein [Flavobacteriales bacterium TMED191]
MSVFTLIENWNGEFKKTSFETLSYGKNIANQKNQKLVALTLGANNANLMTEYGADKIINITNTSFENCTNKLLSEICSKFIQENDVNTSIISNTNMGKSISPLLANETNHGLITNAISLPESQNPLIVQCKGFSGKAHVKYQSNYNLNIITIIPNSIGEIKKITGDGELLNIEFNIEDISQGIQILSREKTSEKISLSDANIVISAGRGLKGPENWTMIEELAELLGAGTACSKPVSDMGWRPHSEHVGQTGIAINPDLYIAIGISGAIQHLAGVNSSKHIVVINTDSEAPFFKAANYGIVGDAFEVVPKLINELKKYKG